MDARIKMGVGVMKRMGLLVVLGGLLLFGAGCGGSGSNGGNNNNNSSTVTIDGYKEGTYEIGLYYTVTNSDGDYIKMTVVNIEVKSNSLKVNCTWTATNNSGKDKIFKLSDEDTTNFYIVDNENHHHDHISGTGAAYTKTVLSETAVEGAYYFEALDDDVESIYFYDSVYDQQTGRILFSGNT
jgi:hypothetical protein